VVSDWPCPLISSAEQKRLRQFVQVIPEVLGSRLIVTVWEAGEPTEGSYPVQRGPLR
jgi:hypothetical protein